MAKGKDINGKSTRQAKLLSGDKVILLLGRTGVGKITKLATKTEKNIVGHSLQSCTKDVEVFSYLDENDSGRRVVVVDTPGFDDDVESEFEILKRIGNWLTKSYHTGVRLSGILYFHRIADNRFGAGAARYLELLRQIVGAENLPNVHLVTTMNERIRSEDAENRYEELRKKQWAGFISSGATMYTDYVGTTDSARKLITSIQTKEVVPVLQRELAINKTPLQKTKAGKDLYKSFLQYILERIRKIMGPLEALLDKGGNPDAKDQGNTLTDLQRRLREFDDTRYPEIVQKVRKTTLGLADLAETQQHPHFRISVAPLANTVLNTLIALPVDSEKRKITITKENLESFGMLEQQLEETRARMESVSTA